MKIALYAGKSLVSRLIRWRTRSLYSHAALLMDDGTTIAAWHRGGVRWHANLSVGHTPGTRVDLFEVSMSDRQAEHIARFCAGEIGLDFDLCGALRLRRANSAHPHKWVCAELIFAALRLAGVLHHPLGWVENYAPGSPGELASAPELRFVKTVYTQ